MNHKTIKTTALDEEKLILFKERLCKLFNCDVDTLTVLFQNRPSDPLLLGYNADITKFAISFNGEEWKKNCIGDFELFSAIPLPVRGSVWKSLKTFQYFIVTDFVNIRSPKPKEEPPMIVYMDVNGNSKTIGVMTWFEEMISFNRKLV